MCLITIKRTFLCTVMETFTTVIAISVSLVDRPSRIQRSRMMKNKYAPLLLVLGFVIRTILSTDGVVLCADAHAFLLSTLRTSRQSVLVCI